MVEEGDEDEAQKGLEPLGDPVEVIPCRRQDGVDAIALASLEIISVQSVL